MFATIRMLSAHYIFASEKTFPCTQDMHLVNFLQNLHKSIIMNKKLILSSLLFSCLSVMGLQAAIPSTFQFQAAVRNEDGSIAANKPIEMKIRIIKGSPEGEKVYEETHTTSTNISGIVTLKIGSGVNTSRSATATLSNIEWSNDNYFIETLVDRGDGYISQGIQQLLSVPYAKCAQYAENVYVQSPNGTTWKIIVNNDGSISTEIVAEP